MRFKRAVLATIGALAASSFMALSGKGAAPSPLWAEKLQICTADCKTNGCPLFQHYADPAPQGNGLNSSHPDCLSNTCAEAHPPCPGFALYDDGAASKVWRSLTSGSDAEVLDVVRRYSDFVDVNKERGVIHVLNCDRTNIIANVPYPKRLEASLAAADAE